jgi:hypothetical protein
MAHEAGVEVARLRGHLVTDPRWNLDRRVRAGELDLGDDQAVVHAGEHIDFPGQAGVLDPMPGLLDQRWLAQPQQFLGIAGRDLGLEFDPAGAV